MNKIKLQKRELLGKKAKRVKAEGMIPAVLYNAKGESTSVKALEGELIKLLAKATTTTIIELELDGKTTKAVIKEVDTHPITDHVRHIAFYEVDENTEAVFSVPFTLVGVSPAVRNTLGVLVQTSQSIDIKAKIGDLVPAIEIDISDLDMPGKTIAIKDIELPEGLKLIREEDSEIGIVTVTKIQKAVEVEEDGDEDGEDLDGEEGEEGAEGEEATADKGDSKK